MSTSLSSRASPRARLPNRGSLQLGATYSLQSYQVQRNTDGRRLLTLAVDLLDQGRVVTIPIELSPVEVAQLIKMLGPALVQDN